MAGIAAPAGASTGPEAELPKGQGFKVWLDRKAWRDFIVATPYVWLLFFFLLPFFIVFGALSDRIGRKSIMMAGCLLAALSLMPIYKMMQSATGSNVVTATSQRNPITGAIALTPMTIVDGTLQAAKEVLPYSSFSNLISDPIALKLIGLVFIQVILGEHRGRPGPARVSACTKSP